jgi:hypothetical protein
MRTSILAASSVFCLLGCSTPEDQARKQQAGIDRIVAEFGPACTQLGYVPQSDPWRNCVLRLASNQGVKQGGVSTSIFGHWGSWGRGSGVGIGVGVGR